MSKLTQAPPAGNASGVIDELHGLLVADPYRWLEDQQSPETREWLRLQSEYARNYLEGIPGRTNIRNRIEEFLNTETIDSVLTYRGRYIFRKRVRGQEQPCIFMREGRHGEDHLLLDPVAATGDPYSSIKPAQISPDGRLLLYELKEGGRRVSSFGIVDVDSRKILGDSLPSGFLRGFAFAPDSTGFYYVHHTPGSSPSRALTAYRHVLGTRMADDQQIFTAEGDGNVRLQLIPGEQQLGFLVNRLGTLPGTDFYIWEIRTEGPERQLVNNATYTFGPLLCGQRILAITDLNAPNLRIVEVRAQQNGPAQFSELVPERGHQIRSWTVTADRVFVLYLHPTQASILVFGLDGSYVGELPIERDRTVRIVAGSPHINELLLEEESFFEPRSIYSYGGEPVSRNPLSSQSIRLDLPNCGHRTVSYTAGDGTQIPMFLVGCGELGEPARRPTIMTAYGGFGLAMTPQFSVFASVLMEQGCLFSLPQIRGGSDLGRQWHDAGKRRQKQTAVDDFLSAAKWLVNQGFTDSKRLAIFGGSHAGLLVAAAITQQPKLFRVAVCLLPLTDMLRYHLFDQASLWIEEFGSAEDPDDFAALAAYSPYHAVRDGVSYPAVMVISGDADQNCNPMHARKFVARLQAANRDAGPIILDYHPQRGHSPTMPFSQRVESLTDRLAFVSDQLGLV